MARKPIKGDFGHVRRHIRRDQVVGIFDLVGFTDQESNDDLLAAVNAMETQIGLVIENEDYAWDDRERGGRAFERNTNEILLRSTGDGYFIAFSQADPVIETVECLVKIHKGITRSGFDVKLGVNKGANYVVMDMCDRVNLVGWGINYAARALGLAQSGQIICTEFIAKPLMEEHGDVFTGDIMIDLGERQVKNSRMGFFNYYKEDDFGAPFIEDE